MTHFVTPLIPTRWADERDHRERAARAINQILQGKTNNTGSVTLTANATTTTITDVRIGNNTVVLLQPTTANAAGALATTYPGTPVDGSVVINHANAATADRVFRFVIVG